MRRLIQVASIAGVIAAALAALMRWNYAAFAMRYPVWKLQLRRISWRWFGDPFEREAERIAGWRSMNCGTSGGDGGRANSISNCIYGAIHERRGFYARFNSCGFDSCGADGLAGDRNGSVYQLYYDLLQEDVSLARRRCPSPLRLGTSKGLVYYQLVCLPEATGEDQWERIRDDFAEERRRANHPRSGGVR